MLVIEHTVLYASGRKKNPVIVTNRNLNLLIRGNTVIFSCVSSSAPRSLEVKDEEISDDLLRSLYTVFRFPRGVNRLKAS